MLKKLSLDMTKEYEKHLALKEISAMLVSFVCGGSHYLAIGGEQGDIDKWDDLVIEKNEDYYIHIQAKRQTTDFSSDSVKRDFYTQGKRKGIQRDLSPLDEAIRSLGERVDDKILKKEFWLVVPEFTTQIKKGLEIRHLIRLCENDIKSVTTSHDLKCLQQIDGSIDNIFHWLTTWCDFKDWDHILNVLKKLRIKSSGLEMEIREIVDENLRRIFIPQDIEKVRLLILSYLNDNATFAGAIRPRQLLYLLKDHLLPSISRWTLFNNDKGSWSISGINDLENNDIFERPSILIPNLWSLGNPNSRQLKINGDFLENCRISECLIRLSLHPQGSFDIICSNRSSWEQSIINKTGGTLGISTDDLKGLRIISSLKVMLGSSLMTFDTITDTEDYSQELNAEMYKITFKRLCEKMLSRIRDTKSGELRTEIESKWNVWKPILENDLEEQKKLFSKILHPVAEGASVLGELRVGPSTVNLLTEAVFLLLVVSICLGDSLNQLWNNVSTKLEMTSVGLAYWSGPAGGSKRIIEIDDDIGLSKLLENESEQIIILPQSKLNDLEVFNDDIFNDITKITLLTHPKYPKLLVTNDRKLKQLLKEGNVSDLKKYFQNSLNNYANIIEDSINLVVDEVVL